MNSGAKSSTTAFVEGAIEIAEQRHEGAEAVRRVWVQLFEEARDAGLRVEWILETHAHADHLSAAPYLKEKTGAPIGIGEHITPLTLPSGQ